MNVKGSWALGNATLDRDTSNISAGVLFPYVRDASIYRCPVDKSRVREHPALRRTRSYSIDQWLNLDATTGMYQDGIKDSPFNLRKLSRLVNPPTSQAWIFIEEHETSIDDGSFKIANPWFGNTSPDSLHLHWVDFRADRHNNGADLSFADGHVEPHHWRFHHASWRGDDHPQITDPLDREDLKWLFEGIPHSP